MVSARQLAANHANALKSTGPRTAAGKAKAAANALASGLYAKLVVLPALGETPDGFLAFQHSAVKALGIIVGMARGLMPLRPCSSRRLCCSSCIAAAPRPTPHTTAQRSRGGSSGPDWSIASCAAPIAS